MSACDSQRLVYHTDPALVSTARCRRGGSSATADTCRHCYHHTDSARIIRGRVYVTIRCPSVCPSVCPILSRSCGVRRWFAAVGRAGRARRSIAARRVWRRRGRLSVHIHSTVASSEQCRVYSCWTQTSCYCQAAALWFDTGRSRCRTRLVSREMTSCNSSFSSMIYHRPMLLRRLSQSSEWMKTAPSTTKYDSPSPSFWE